MATFPIAQQLLWTTVGQSLCLFRSTGKTVPKEKRYQQNRYNQQVLHYIQYRKIMVVIRQAVSSTKPVV